MKERKQAVLRIGAVAGMAALVFGAYYLYRGKNEPISATSFHLNTVVKITIYDSQEESLLEGAMELCDTYEKILSRTRTDSELYRLNHSLLPKEEDGASLLSPVCAEVIEEGLDYSRLSGGAFDISIEPVSSLWDFTSEDRKVPGREKLEAARELVGYEDVRLEENRLYFEKEGMGLELGAIAKGYIADRIKEYLVAEGVKSAVIDLGGNVLCIGSHPNGTPFQIGIQQPFAARNETVATVAVSDRSVVSSGVYERYFEQDGKRYHHILNPETGYPYENGLMSVTIISERSVDGDGLSTACFALGLEAGMELVNSREGVQAVFITEDGRLYCSEGLEGTLRVTDAQDQDQIALTCASIFAGNIGESLRLGKMTA